MLILKRNPDAHYMARPLPMRRAKPRGFGVSLFLSHRAAMDRSTATPQR